MATKRQSEINWYKQELKDAENSRNQALENGYQSALRGDVTSVFLHRAMVDGISGLISKLHENTIALMSNEKVYICEWCGNDTRTLYDVNNHSLCPDCEIEANE